MKYIAEGGWTEREQSIGIVAMKSLYMCIPDYIISAYNHLSIDLIDNCIVSLYWFGTYIKTYFNEDDYYMEMAIELWKKAIQLHQEYGCSYENYKVENYVTEIKKIEKEYIAPEKPTENVREKNARKKAEKAQEEAKKAKKDKITLIIILAILAAVIIIGGLLPYIAGN